MGTNSPLSSASLNRLKSDCARLCGEFSEPDVGNRIAPVPSTKSPLAVDGGVLINSKKNAKSNEVYAMLLDNNVINITN